MMLGGLSVDLSTYDWQAVAATAAILTALLTALLVASVFVGYRHIRETILQRDASLLLFCIEQMESIKSDLRSIEMAPTYGTLDAALVPDFVSPWDRAVEESALRVSQVMQRLGYLVEANLISEVHLLRMFGPVVADSWVLLEPWVKRYRMIKGEPVELDQGAFRRGDFERLARRCLEQREL